MPTLSVIIPTCGRPTLPGILHQLLPQLGDGDEVIVVGDGPQPAVRGLIAGLLDRRIRCHEHADPQSVYGNAQRNAGMALACGERLVFVDDDDELPLDALRHIRRETAEERPVLFRMSYCGELIWRNPVIAPGNFGGVQFVVPNRSGRVAEWPVPASNPDLSDFEWITRTLAKWPDDALKWSESVVYIARGHSRGSRPTTPLSVPNRIPRLPHLGSAPPQE
jgi:glycosyltransferase involved in cell wall biosynthesis